MIRISGVSKSFGARKVLSNLDLVVPEGNVTALLGDNGAGKTSLIRILSTGLIPDSGNASVGGFDVVRCARDVRRLIGVTGQFVGLDETATVERNLILVGSLFLRRSRQVRVRARELLVAFDLESYAEVKVRHCSGGVRRRLDIAMSLIGRPAVLFLDEPSTGLDPTSRSALWELVRGLSRGGTTILLTTQYLEEADRLASSVAFLAHGQIVRHDSPEIGKIFSVWLNAALPPEASGPWLRQDDEGRRIDVLVDELDDMRTALMHLERWDASVRDFVVREPTMEDAYLALRAGQC